MQLTNSQAVKIKTLMLARTQPAYLTLNRDLHLLEWSENIVEYGYEGMQEGQDATDIFVFLVGYEGKEQLDLPIVTSPNKTHCSISILIEQELIYVLLMDAGKDFEQQFLLQQKANEANLLNIKQRKLMSELIATQKELELKNQQLQGSFSLQRRFLSGVSHEFRSPLTSIIGYANALREQLKEFEKTKAEVNSSEEGEEDKEVVITQTCRDKLRIIGNNSSYLLSLVENLLDHGKLSEQEIILQPKLIELGNFFSSLHEMLFPIAERKDIDFLLTIGSIGSYLIDETRVRQCVVNLVNNAIKFTEKGSVELGFNHQDEELHIWVKDTGIGMSEKEQNNIYESFWQSKNHSQTGAGLGMTITKRIVESMAGEIDIVSELGEGTEVTISFPAHKEEAEQSEIDNNASEVSPKLKILLVEDDLDISELVQFYLNNWGYESHTCHDGQQALDWLDSNSPDIVFLDLNMPVLNGVDTLQAIRESNLDLPVYIMSAQSMGNDDELDEVLHRDANGHILKPVDFNGLKSLLEQHA